MAQSIKKFMCGKGLKIIWLSDRIGMNPKTLYSKLDGSRPILAHELDQINAVLGTSFEAKGEKNDRN